MPQKAALLAVYDKTGLPDVAKQLSELGFALYASKGSAKAIREAGIGVHEVGELPLETAVHLTAEGIESLTKQGIIFFNGDQVSLPDWRHAVQRALSGKVGEPILDHRVVTLIWEVYAGILADMNKPRHVAELEDKRLPFFDFVYVSLYPMGQEIQRSGATPETVLELTDIGGPTLIRAAAKGRRIVVTCLADAQDALLRMQDGTADDAYRQQRAAHAEMVIASYCLTSARYISGGVVDGMIGHQVAQCKYGENAWQTPASLFSTDTDDPLALDKFLLVAGTDPSLVNMCDVDRMLQTITHIAAGLEENGEQVPFIAMGVKHGNPCGAAVHTSSAQVAIAQMLEGDPLAIHGGWVMLNIPVDGNVARYLREFGMPEGKKRLLDGVVAPSFTDDALDELWRKGGKCRAMANPALAHLSHTSMDVAPRFRQVRGGFLRQPNYTFVLNLADERHARYGGDYRPVDVILAWAVGSTSNSNTITLVKDGMLIGNGTGQQDRVGAAELAVRRARRANHNMKGAIAYSDSFFPFPDGPKVLIDAGVRTIITSSGSVNDGLTIAVCKEAGITLLMIPDQIGRGFFGH